MAEYEFKKTLEKFGIAFAEIVVAGTIVYLTDNNLYLLVVPLLEAVRNWLKHRKK